MKNDQSKEDDMPCCAHNMVDYKKIKHGNGTCSDSWVCRDCDTKFWPSGWIIAQEQTKWLMERDAEIDHLKDYAKRLKEENRELYSETSRLNGMLEKAREVLKPFTTIPCTCIDAYKDRGLSAPDCEYHNWEGEIKDAKEALSQLSQPKEELKPEDCKQCGGIGYWILEDEEGNEHRNECDHKILYDKVKPQSEEVSAEEALEWQFKNHLGMTCGFNNASGYSFQLHTADFKRYEGWFDSPLEAIRNAMRKEKDSL